jgi:hypothetical protein
MQEVFRYKKHYFVLPASVEQKSDIKVDSSIGKKFAVAKAVVINLEL